MPFPWTRYLRFAGAIFVVALVVSFVVGAAVTGGHISANSAFIAVVDSAVLAVVAAFPLTQRISSGPRRR